MNKIKIGLAGCGLAWEKLHLPAFSRLCDKFEIVAVSDTDMKKALRAAASLNVGSNMVFWDYREMIEKTRGSIEAVDIMLPIEDNGKAASFAISNNLNIIAEKPFSATSDEAKILINSAKNKKIKILVAENFRYAEESRIIKDLLNKKTIGEVMYFIDNNASDFQDDMKKDTFASREWRQHPEFKGGIFLDSAVHHVARMRFLFGAVKKVVANGHRDSLDFSPYSCINAMLTFENQVTGMYSYLCKGKETQSPLVGLRIFGTDGEIYLEEKSCGFVNLSLKNGESQAIPYKPEEGYYNEFQNYYDAMRNNAEIVSTPEKELGDIQTIEEILKSCV